MKTWGHMPPVPPPPGSYAYVGVAVVAPPNKLHSPDRKVFALGAHAAPSGECIELHYYMVLI